MNRALSQPSTGILLAALLATAVIYWSGLHGPFIFDDGWNLEPVRLWLANEASWREVLFPRPSIVESRPVAMASFLASAAIGEGTSFSYKLGNLLLHLASGVAGWTLLRRVILRDPRLATHASLIASIVCAAWLLHPLHTSTVLYAVQRMAQLSSLFALLAVLTYVVGREYLQSGRQSVALVLLFAVFPALLLAGILSKQNAACTPLLCLAIEWAYFLKDRRGRGWVHAFYALFLGLPAVAATAILVAAPDRLLSVYAEWDFTLWQRLMTQPRALMQYVGMLLIPRTPFMGLYTDDFEVSTALFEPPWTAASVAFLLAITAGAVYLRRSIPSAFLGWFFFLGAHAVESSFLPLEMYYEHRNYLPSFGLFLAVTGLCATGLRRLRTNVVPPARLAAFGFGLLLLALSIATFGRVLIWKDMDAIVAQGVKYHPNSMRARFDETSLAVGKGDHAAAMESMAYLSRSNDPRHRQLGNLSLAALRCAQRIDARPPLEAAAKERLPRLTTYEAQSFMRLNDAIQAGDCGMPALEVAAYLRDIIDSAASQPETATPKWFSRYALAELYVRADRWDLGSEQAERAWQASKDQKVGALAAAIDIYLGDLEGARLTIEVLEASIPRYDIRGRRALADLHRLYREKVESMADKA